MSMNPSQAQDVWKDAGEHVQFTVLELNRQDQAKELETYQTLTGPKYQMPATKGDLFLHIRANDEAAVYKSCCSYGTSPQLSTKRRASITLKDEHSSALSMAPKTRKWKMPLTMPLLVMKTPSLRMAPMPLPKNGVITWTSGVNYSAINDQASGNTK